MSQSEHHLVWVWQFSTDASPEKVGARLRDHGLGIVMKTHDGVEWMNKYDKSPFAISGPVQIKTLADYYEAAGVPFHAWCVVLGTDPLREARMATEVLNAGARSIFLDVEPYSSFWQGTPADAEAYGRELRRLAPNGNVVLSVDPRPWLISKLPLKQFAAFSNEVAPQQYWRTFNTQANYDKFAQSGYPVGPEGITPEFLLKVSNVVLAPLGLPIIQVGQGATPDTNEWKRFIDGHFSTGGNVVSVWRYGVTADEVLQMLRDMPPRRPVAAGVVASGGVYVIKDGDSLSAIAVTLGVSTDDLIALNKIADPSLLYVGQELKIPGGGSAAGQTVSDTSTSAAASGGGSNPKTYTVQSGDTLGAIAGRFNTSVDALVKLNGLTDAGSLSVGQDLKLS